MSDPSKELASWEKHTKGIGSKLLQKFGFTGRLGANETGIEKAIEVQVRPTNVGLGFGSNEGAGKKPSKKRISADENQENPLKKARKSAPKAKSKKSRPSIQQAFLDFPSEKTYKIIDMTNVTGERAFDSESETDDQESDDGMIFSDGEGEYKENEKNFSNEYNALSTTFLKSKEPLLSPELREVKHKLSTNQNSLRIVNNKLTLLDERKRLNEKKMQNLKIISSTLSEIKDLLQANENILSNFQKQSPSSSNGIAVADLSGLLNNLQLSKTKIGTLLITYEEECSLFGLNGVFMQFFHQLLRGCFQMDTFGLPRLQFLRESTFENLHLVLNAIKDVLDEKLFNYNIKRDIEMSVLAVLTEKILLKELLDFMTKEFNPVEHTPVFIKYFLLFKPYIFQNSSLIQKFLDILKISLIPKLLSSVQNWTYSFGTKEFSVLLQPSGNYSGINILTRKIIGTEKSFLIHNWIIPYVELMESVDKQMITQLFPEVRRKIIQILKLWQPVPTEDDASSCDDKRVTLDIEFISDLISPWRQYFDVQSYTNMILKYLLPKLNHYFQTCFFIDPANQNIKPFLNILIFYSKRVIPFDYFQIFLLSGFFSKFLPVLISWLQSFQVSKDLMSLQEIGLWYKGWRSLFPPEFFDVEIASLSTLPNNSKVDHEIRNNFQIMTMFGLCLNIIQKHLELYESSLSSSFLTSQSSITLFQNQILRKIQEMNYQKIIELYHLKNQLIGSQNQNQNPSSQLKDHPSTLKEMVEKFAKEKNIQFHLDDLSFGQRNARVAGKHIYRFGINLIYFENNVIYKYQKSMQEWIPASIRELEL